MKGLFYKRLWNLIFIGVWKMTEITENSLIWNHPGFKSWFCHSVFGKAHYTIWASVCWTLCDSPCIFPQSHFTCYFKKQSRKVNASEWVKNLRLAGEVKPKGIKVLLEGSMLLVRSVKSNLFNKKTKNKNPPVYKAWFPFQTWKDSLYSLLSHSSSFSLSSKNHIQIYNIRLLDARSISERKYYHFIRDPY